MSDYIDDVFGSAGLLAAHFKGYAPRVGQIALARAVDDAIRSRGHLLAEAPTGTGKSLAYAVPAIWHVKHPQPLPPAPPEQDDPEADGVNVDRRYEEGEPPRPCAVIVTANIALQEQLVRKDLPLLYELLPWKFTYALLKGVGNYLCRERLEDGNQRCDPNDAGMDYNIREWAEHTETGDKSELPFEPPGRVWSHFSVSSDDCMGKDCSFYKNCFPRLARAKAKTADVIVTNYALFFLDMIVRERSKGQGSVIPPYNIAILDEGHKAVDIARDYFGFRVTEGMIDWAASMVESNDLKIDVHREQSKFFAALREHKNSPLYKARIRKPEVVDARGLKETLVRVASSYLPEIEKLNKKKEELAENGLKLSDEDKRRLKKLVRKAVRASELHEQIDAAMRLYTLPKAPWVAHPENKPDSGPEERWYYSDPQYGGNNTVLSEVQLRTIDDVFFIEEEGWRTILYSMPISIADRLRAYLFRMTDSVSVTSATLVARGSFDYIAGDLGIERQKTLIAESPFAWRTQALLVLPTDVPEPTAPMFQKIVCDRFVETVELARGRTLGLFTSYKNLNAAYERVVKSTNFRILKQGDMPRTKLIDEFRRDVNSVLMGVESFWAGVDVQGESLSCVFIDKLPFASPDDPLLSALEEKEGKTAWMKYNLPQAIIAFKQGFGRLIRTTTDKGVVVLLDRRVSTKFYGRQFIAALPPVTQSRDLKDVRRFLDGDSLEGVGLLESPSRSLFDVA